MESIVSEPEPTVNQTNKHKQTTLNYYLPSFTKQDQKELESLLHGEYLKKKKAKRLALYFRNHQILLATLRRIQKEKYGYEVALTLTVETRWMSVFECLDHILKTKIAIRALLAEENIILNQEIKNYIIDDCFWEELKNLCDFLELFINFIRKLEGDEPYLSSAFVTLQDIENNILLNNKISNDLVEYSINRAKYRKRNYSIRIAGKENEVQVLIELSEYIGRHGGFAKKHFSVAIKVLSIPASLAASEESDKELEGDIDSNFETLTEYEENEFDLDLDD
ncbi:hypothetical protein C1646_749132 [Rhizophagus diaphanus]|nr:hypothetical protein C1646_749132 [Rhizophagus diaphanus] [Rhizophagus sp. MUCL 43196]